MTKLRVVASLPSPFSMSDYEPFMPLGGGKFGISLVTDVTPTEIEHVKKNCKRAFRARHSVGFCHSPKVKAVFFDMDATAIKEESVVALATAVGKGVEVARITELAMAGELDFEQALEERVALLEGLTQEQLIQVGKSLTLNDGILEFSDFCRKIGVPIFLISGGFMQLAAGVSDSVGFTDFYASTLEEDAQGTLTGKTRGEVVDAKVKKQWVLQKCEEMNISPLDVAAVGDGANDILMLGAVGTPVGFSPKEVVLDHINALNETRDHRMLIPLLFGRSSDIERSIY